MSSNAILRALAEPRRQAMLRLVRDQPRSVGEIARHFDVTQQAVSQHLQVLKEAGLVDVHRQGQRRLYAVRPDGLQALEDFLAELWPAGLTRLKEAVESDDAPQPYRDSVHVAGPPRSACSTTSPSRRPS